MKKCLHAEASGEEKSAFLIEIREGCLYDKREL
jgi:hypothetical protein